MSTSTAPCPATECRTTRRANERPTPVLSCLSEVRQSCADNQCRSVLGSRCLRPASGRRPQRRQTADRIAWRGRQWRARHGSREDFRSRPGGVCQDFKERQSHRRRRHDYLSGSHRLRDRLGLTEISAEESTNDRIELTDEIMPHMHVYDAFHAESELIPVTRLNGITNAIVAPDSTESPPGADSFVQLAGPSAAEMLLVRDIAMPLNFTGEQRRNESWEKRKFPETRMGMAAPLRQAFLDAQDYQKKLAEYEQKKADAARDKKPEPSAPKRDLKLEALLPYLQGKKPVVLAAQGPSDLETAVRLAP